MPNELQNIDAGIDVELEVTAINARQLLIWLHSTEPLLSDL